MGSAWHLWWPAAGSVTQAGSTRVQKRAWIAPCRCTSTISCLSAYRQWEALVLGGAPLGMAGRVCAEGSRTLDSVIYTWTTCWIKTHVSMSDHRSVACVHVRPDIRCMCPCQTTGLSHMSMPDHRYCPCVHVRPQICSMCPCQTTGRMSSSKGWNCSKRCMLRTCYATDMLCYGHAMRRSLPIPTPVLTEG